MIRPLIVADGFTIECDFAKTATNATIVTRYHFLDYERHFEMDRYYSLDVKRVIYKDKNIMEKLTTSNHIKSLQTIEQTCTPARQLIHELDSPFDKDTNVCQCKIYGISSYLGSYTER